MGACQNEDSQLLSPGEEFGVHFTMNTLRDPFGHGLGANFKKYKSAKVNYVLE